MSEELKPCPFCGKNHLWTYSVSYAPEGLRFVKCAKDPQEDDGCVDGVSLSTWQKRPIEDALRAENEKLKEALKLLRNWTKAYPLDMFPEPDLKLARKLLTDGGVSYDALNAYSMRHVINGVARIIDEAIKCEE